ncbi:hypothetical protein K439DRAFT_1411408 [Ramaria rubella]|nr:hypothetical protein K439DRAFT_1411408 [Ramaria rubella]
MSFLRLRPVLIQSCYLQSTRPLSLTRALYGETKDSSKPVADPAPRSSCPPNTVLEGLVYLKDQPPILALPDEEYPPWLWDVLKPKVWPDDGPGGKAEKVRLRKENRQRIKDQNFMKTQ